MADPVTAASDVAAVEVVYALPDEQTLIEVAYREGMTAADAIAESGITERFPALAARPLTLGIHGAEVAGSRPVQPGDRVEICRPLVADPRRMRVAKVSEGRTMARGPRDD